MQTPKGRSGSQDAPRRISRNRSIHQLETTGLESGSMSSPVEAKTPKGKSPKITERRLPSSPISERKRPSRIRELESQITQLQDELKRVKEELNLSESGKKQAVEDAEKSKEQLLMISTKLEHSQKEILELSASEIQTISQEKDETQPSQIDVMQQQHSVDSASVTSAASEIQQLKDQIEGVAESEAQQNEHRESTDLELRALKTELVETLSLVENLKGQLQNRKELERQARALADNTLVQLEAAMLSVDAAKSESKQIQDAYNSISLELEQSNGQVKSLEAVVSKLKSQLLNAAHCEETAAYHDTDAGNQKSRDTDLLEAEIDLLKSEVEGLRSTLEAAESKHHEELAQIKSASVTREAELEAEIKLASAKIDELKAELMDKETELQGISEENEGLITKLNKSLSSQRESSLETEVKKLKENVMGLKSVLIQKETELQNILEENKILKIELGKREVKGGQSRDNLINELEAARVAEQEVLAKLELVSKEAERGNRRADRAMEQLEAAQSVNSEMEAELRRIKVQSNQWRKAAEAAVSMLSIGNNVKVMDETGKIGSPYHDDLDDDMLRKKNGNMLKKIGVLWKKSQR